MLSRENPSEVAELAGGVIEKTELGSSQRCVATEGGAAG